MRFCVGKPVLPDASAAASTRDPKNAETVAGAGDNAVERAAWTETARAILNLDEFVTRE